MKVKYIFNNVSNLFFFWMKSYLNHQIKHNMQ